MTRDGPSNWRQENLKAAFFFHYDPGDMISIASIKLKHRICNGAGNHTSDSDGRGVTTMTFVKCVLVGLLSLIVAVIFLVVGLIVVFAALTPRGGETIGFDVVTLWHHFYLHCLVVTVSMFALGFSWEYRRLKRRTAATNP
jgi:hypothetical protein